MPRHLVEAVEVTESEIHLIRLKGIFDASTVNEFEKVVSYLLTRNFFCMVVDLSAVEFISSAGWGAFTAELRRVRENNGDIKLAGMSADLFDVFLLLELDRFINAYETADEGIMAFLQPAPEPVADDLLEMPVTLRERFGTPATINETPAIEAPAVYSAASPMITAPMHEGRREKYDRNNDEVYIPEPRSTAIVTHGEDYWTPRQNFKADDTLEVDRERRRLGSGRERRERLLTSGPATIEYADVPRILPPPAIIPPEDQKYAEPIQSAEPQYDINDAGGETEFDFSEPDATLAEHEEPIAAANSMRLLTEPQLHTFDDEPRAEKTYEKNEFFAPQLKPESVATNSRPRKFSWQEAEAFSELSLDLESHLQAHGRYEEAEDDFNTFEEFHDEKPKPLPAPTNREEETQQFNTIVFSADETLAESDGDTEEVNFEAPYIPIADSKPAQEPIFPAFNHDAVDFSNEGSDEPLEAPRFNNFMTAFQLNPNPANQRMRPEHDDDFETQDIRDPWILEEIDTLPEEYEIDDAAAVYDDRPIATAEFSAYDFESETEIPPTSVAEDTSKSEEAPLTLAAASEVLEAPDIEMSEAAPHEMEGALDFEVPDSIVDDAAANDAIANDAVHTAGLTHQTDETESLNEVLVLPEARELILEAKTLPVASTMEEVPKIPMSGDLVEMIRGIIAAYPHFGPTMICKFLEERVEPPVYLSRSTIYRYLREANLSTRQQRLEYAGAEFRLTDETAYEA